MERFIGTKIIHAEPMEKEGKAGYKVVYKDGYESWSPADAFEEAYRRADGLPFGLAIEALKKGLKVARKGWNGEGMFLYLASGAVLQLDEVDAGTACQIRGFFADKGMDECEICSHINMKSADNKIVIGWLASQTDMLTDDWYIVD